MHNGQTGLCYYFIIKDRLGVSVSCTTFGGVKITVSIRAVRIEEDEKLFRPLWSVQLEEARVKQTVAGA